MTEDLITFETAKLAYEKGVHLTAHHRFFVDVNGDVEEVDRNDTVHDHVVEIYNRPTQSLLQKWLREEHGIDLQSYFIEYRSNGRLIELKSEDRTYSYRIYKNGLDNFVWTSEPEFDTYEEALEKGLQEALKLI